MVAAIDWTELLAAYAKRDHAFLERIDHRPQDTPSPTSAHSTTSFDSWKLLLRATDLKCSKIRCGSVVAGVLQRDPALPIDRRQGFFEMGMDSLTSIQLRRTLEAEVERSLPATLTFNFPTIAALTEFLAKELSAAPVTATGLAPERVAIPRSAVAHDSLPAGALAAAETCDDVIASEDELLDLLASKVEQVRWKY